MTDETMSEQERKFDKLRREIEVATREQGDDPSVNRRLRMALARAEGLNMPDAQVDSAKQRGLEGTGLNWEERTFEGYGDAGIAVLVETITDDASRTAAELEHLFAEHGGNLGDDGCVSWQFERRGVVEVAPDDVDDADAFLLEVIEVGGQELVEPNEMQPHFAVYCDPDDLHDVDEALRDEHDVKASRIVHEPQQRIGVDRDTARAFMRFFERLQAHPDVQNAYANWTFA